MTLPAARILGVNVKDPARWNAGVVASKDGESLTQSQDIPYGYCHCGCGEKTNISRVTNRSRGYVRGEPLRFLPSHTSTKRRIEILPYRVEDRGFGSPCWIWSRAIVDGYGMAYVDGRMQGAHRLFYEAHVNPIPSHLVLDHLCRNRACVNPDHLEPVPNAENIRRGMRTKLTEDQKRHIAALPSEYGLAPMLAKKYGVAVGTIHNIRHRYGKRVEAAANSLKEQTNGN